MMMTKTLQRTLAAVACVLCFVAPSAAEKQSPPEPGKPKDFQVPKPKRFTLANGMKVTFVSYGTIPKASVHLFVRTGNIDEAANQVWVAELVGQMLTQGTATRTASQIAQQAADMGGGLDVNVGEDRTGLGIDVLSESTAKAVELVADVAKNAKFPESELARLKTDSLRRLSIAKSQPQQIALERFRATLYPDHPYGRMFPTSEMLQAYTLADLRGFYDKNFGAARSHLFIAGRFDEAAVEKAVRAAFDGWKKGPAPTVNPPKPKLERRLETIDRPGAVQSTIYLGVPTIDPSSPDYVAFTVMNALLGGSFASRITSNIREQKGYTYSPRSQISTRFKNAYWVEIADVTTKDTGASLKEIFSEIDRLQAEPPPAAELKGIQNYLAGTFVLQNSSRQGIVGQLAFMDMHNLPDDYLTTYVQKVYAVTPADVQKSAATHIPDDRATIVVAGDLKVVNDQLASYAKPSGAAPASK
jgi:predicted Zn-dependent peptidase